MAHPFVERLKRTATTPPFAAGAVLALVAVVLLLQAHYLLTEETIDIVVVDSADGTQNATRPIRLKRSMILRNLVREIARLHGEMDSHTASLRAERKKEVEEVQAKVAGVRAGSHVEVQKVLASVGKVEEALAMQQMVLQQQKLRMERMKVEIDYRRERHTPRTANFTRYTIDEDSPLQWQQRTFRRHGAYGLVKFSAYRVSPSLISVLGLAALSLHESRRLWGCSWHHPVVNGGGGVKEGEEGTEGVIKGSLEMVYVGEHHNFLYETVILNCNLKSNVTRSGGYLKALIDSEEVILFVEDKGQPLQPPSDAGPFPHALSFCGPPMYGSMEAEYLGQWMEYHRVYMPTDHFYLYDSGGVDEAVTAVLRPYEQEGIVTMTNFRESEHWDVWLWGQGLGILDCVYRTRPTSRWVYMHDFDEFFEMKPPQSVQQLLKKHDSAPWLSHGCIVYSIKDCVDKEVAGGEGSFVVERMRFHWPHVYCQMSPPPPDANFCIDQFGHRKYFINPRKVTAAQIHIVTLSQPGGVDLSVAEAHHSHFQGLAGSATHKCGKGEPQEWWVKADGVAKIAKAVRACPWEKRKEGCNFQLNA